MKTYMTPEIHTLNFEIDSAVLSASAGGAYGNPIQRSFLSQFDVENDEMNNIL